MIYKLARFTVKEEALPVCLEAIEEFVAAIKEHEPGVRQYDSYQIENGTRFIHLMAFKDEQSEKNHQRAAHTLKFVEVLYPNCEVEPIFEELKPIGSRNT